ncbi:MAG TPA: HAMP domain-containing sensor histidine kinase [Bacteroidales bacterium]|nr:HAMP domain-containing sensor histidine kinase [Bacteroidales bacterium]
MWKLKIVLPVLAALVIFLFAQVYLVRQVWMQKDEVFSLRYRSESKEAIREMAIYDPYNGFKKAYWVIDDVSSLYLQKSKNLRSSEDSALFAREIRESYTSILSEDQLLTEHLSKYFEKLGLESKIKSKIYVNYIDLIDIQENISVFRVSDEMLRKQSSQKSIPVYTFTSEGNNYKISFDYYIDVANKEAIMMKELSLTLIFSFISFVIILVIFIGTLKNFMEEKRLSNLKTDFINNMTHELKTPLSTITVAAKTLRHESVIHDRKKIMDTSNMISKQSVQLNELINLILEISMWERTQFQLDRKNTDIATVLREISDNFRNGCGNQCNYTERIEIKGAMAEIDILYFTTMINNLLNNALKYSGEDPEVTLHAYTRDKNIVIKVKDNGIGISRSDQKNIFDKFYRVSTGNIHKAKGLGLGLYYVKKIAEEHGGFIDVSSRKGKGSVFIVNIPLNI